MTIESASSSDWDHLFYAAREGLLSDEEFANLEQLLLTDAEARCSYLNYMSMVAGIREGLESLNPSLPEKGAVENLDELVGFQGDLPRNGREVSPVAGSHSQKHESTWGRLLQPVSLKFLIAASIRLSPLIAIIVIYLFATMSAEPKSSPIAEIRDLTDCRWGTGSNLVSVGTQLSAHQRLELISGTAKLYFTSGTSVAIEGPSALELMSPSSMKLYSGTVAVRAMGEQKDFKVFTPDASIADLGTSFGVHFSDGTRTQVEVFEGAVEVFPGSDQSSGQVLDLGGAARVTNQHSEIFTSEVDHFGKVIESLWEDLRATRSQQLNMQDMQGEGAVVATFADGPQPGTIDTFKGAKRGGGWLTPWIACGNPIWDIRSESPLSSEQPDYLHLGFQNSTARTIGREYGAVPGFDPSQPHVISWRWRFDSTAPEFGNAYKDRIHFFGSSCYRRSSEAENTWLIGYVAEHEQVGRLRQMIPGNWYLFDGLKGETFENKHMVDTGMPLKQGVTYFFQVTVYPREGLYDVVIQDDEQTFTKSGLGFRNKNRTSGHVVHFGTFTDDPTTDTSFSLDAIRIEQVPPAGVVVHGSDVSAALGISRRPWTWELSN